MAGGIGLLLKREAEQIRSALRLVGEKAPRMRQYRLEARLLLDDTYNASPESVIAALEALCAISKGRPRVAVLGEMHELGSHSAALHEAVGEFVQNIDCELLFTYGKGADLIAHGAIAKGYPKDRVLRFADGTWGELAHTLLRKAPANAVILCKGSRACAMEKIVEEFRRSYEK